MTKCHSILKYIKIMISKSTRDGLWKLLVLSLIYLDGNYYYYPFKEPTFFSIVIIDDYNNMLYMKTCIKNKFPEKSDLSFIFIDFIKSYKFNKRILKL